MTAPTATIAPADLIAIRLIADGHTVYQAARRTGVSNSAMCMRLLRLRERIGARTNAHAVAILTRTGQLNLTQEHAR